MGKIQTVLGVVDAEGIHGSCLAHEHLWIDLRNQASRDAADGAVSASDHAPLMMDPYSMRDNLLLDDAAAAEEECRALMGRGCELVVDCSTAQIGRAPARLRELSERTGLCLVMGCGYYTADTWSASESAAPVEALAERMVSECRDGVDGVRPGVLGEIGTTREILPAERRALSAAARAHRATGLGVQVHIYPWCTNGLEAAAILQRGGVPPEKTVICHSDVAPDRAYILRLLRQGVFVEFDNFGKEFTSGSSYGRFPADAERMEVLYRLVSDGYAKQLLLACDVCLKNLLKLRGGPGYDHVLSDMVPLIRAKYGDEAGALLKTLLVDNPANYLDNPRLG